MPNTKHHYQRVDLENGYLQATRDDTDEIQDFRINAYLKDGSLVKSVRCMYNLQYDYKREQIWKNGVLIKDEILPGHGYGHLQWVLLRTRILQLMQESTQVIFVTSVWLS